MGRKPGPPVLHWRGGVAWVRFTHAGQRFDVSTGERDPLRADEAAARIHAQTVLGRPAPRARPVIAGPDGLDLLSTRYLAWLSGQGRDARYVREQALHFRAHFLQLDEDGRPTRWARLHEITSAAIADYQRERGALVSSVTLYKELVTLSGFLKWCRRQKLLEHVPEFERPTQTTDYAVPDLTRAQVERFLAELPDRAAHPKRYPIREWATFAWSMALRKEEAFQIRWSDIDLGRGRLVVRAEIDKAGLRWELPLTDEARALLEQEAARRAPGYEGQLYPFRSVRGSFEEACARLRAELGTWFHVTPHHLRHARISEWANSTRRLASVQFMARHTSIATTAKYVRSRTEAAEEMLVEMAAAREAERKEQLRGMKGGKSRGGRR